MLLMHLTVYGRMLLVRGSAYWLNNILSCAGKRVNNIMPCYVWKLLMT